MKNKLLKNKILLIFIAMVGFFSYQYRNSGASNNVNDNQQSQQGTEKKETLVSVQAKQKPIKKEAVNFVDKTLTHFNKSNISNEEKIDSIEKIREKYHNLVNYSTIRKRMRLPKVERKAMGLPPNAYNEQEYLYTADPALGRPTPEVTMALQKDLNQKLESGRVPGDGIDNQWVERGANNVGGRTRVLRFAPGSTTKVFAGAVSGGLWVNNDITAAGGSWTQVAGVPSNMAVTCMTVDPQNSNIMYIGTGEVYTWGAVNGNGVYKSIDGGITWRLVFGGNTDVIEDQITYIQDIIAWVNPSTGLTEVYFGADAMAYTEEINSASGGAGWSYLGANTVGLWKSTDGINFALQTNVALESSAGVYCAPNSFTIDFTGKLYMGTKYSYATNAGGGRIYNCTNGTNWALVRNFSTTATDGGRVQLVASKTTTGRFYALCENNGTGLPFIRRSTDGFATVNTTIALPISGGTQPPAATDFCRGQAFYDLMIGMSPTNDNEVYVGGIEIFRTTTAFTATNAAMWTQHTDWRRDVAPENNGPGLDGVHSDHHVMAFAPGLTSRVVFGCDGGIYYSNDSALNISSRNTDYNVTQPYKADINTASTATTRIIAGLQDNGSQYVTGAVPGVNSFTDISGGDGCWEFIEDTDAYVITSYVYNVFYRHDINGNYSYTIASNQSDGDFVNECGLDSVNDKLYTNGTTATPTYQIYRYNLGGASATRTVFSNALLNDIPTFFKPFPTTNTSLLVGLANGRLLKMVAAGSAANSAGITWSNIADASWTGAISDVRFGTTENDIFVTFHNYGIPSVWYSSNGGTSWQNKEGNLPNLPVKCILQNPNATNEVIIGTELGVWYTINFNAASPTWRRANNGMKDVKVLNFEFRALDNTIVAATFGRGVWTGQFWQCGTTTKTWNGSAWLPAGTPTKRDAVVFAGNYTSTASLDACSVTVNTGAAVTFVSGHSLRVGENVTVNGTGSLTINSGAALVQYTKHAVNTGNIIVKRASTNMVRNDYTAWSSPVANQNLLAFSPNTVATRFYQYLFTGTTTPTAYQSVVPSTNSFTSGKGYMIRVDNNWTTTPAAYNGQFTGVPNNGTITYAVGQGYNLLGNPYASPISAYRFLITNPKVNALYYWTHTVAAVAGAYPQNNYASYTTLGGTASAAGGAIPNDKINVGQGFFIQAATAYTVTFENELREDAATTTQFFKSSDDAVTENQEAEKHRIWLNLNDGTKNYNQILLGYTANATNGIDDKIDGKMLDTSKTMLYSLIDNTEYVIQGKGLPFSDEDVVKLGLKVTDASNFEINMQQVDGVFENQDVFVKDNYTKSIHNLKEGSYYFSSQVGTFNDRFEVIYKKPTIEEVVSTNAIDVLVRNNELSIQSYQSAIASVEVYDVLGKVIYTKNGINNKQFNTNQITATNQALLVKIQLENGEVVVKKIIM